MSARVEQMLDMYLEEGLSMTEIGERFGVSRQRVHQLIGSQADNAHYGKARKEIRDERYRQAHARIRAGERTIEEEAEAADVTVGGLRSAIYRLGLRLVDPHESPLHGTYYRYGRGCRCEECRQGNRDYVAKLRARGAPTHGSESSYRNYACRCDACKKAGSEANRAYRLRRKLRDKERMPEE